MNKVQLLHNVKAGDEEHSPEELIKLIESNGFSCDYASVKEKGWDKFSDETDFLVVAGGDGTVKKVVDKLLQRKLIDKHFPMAVLPLGTANNLAKTLGVYVSTEVAVASWTSAKRQPFDVGKIYGLEDKSFFIEAIGYGLFPYLIKRMKNSGKLNVHTPEQELELALEELRNILSTYQTAYCKIEIDGKDYSGDYLMVEVMNIRSIGPNLFLAPKVEVDDGVFDVVLLSEEHRTDFADHLADKLNGDETNPALTVVQGKRIKLEWNGEDCHVDDERLEMPEPREIVIEVQQGLIEFLVT